MVTHKDIVILDLLSIYPKDACLCMAHLYYFRKTMKPGSNFIIQATQILIFALLASPFLFPKALLVLMLLLLAVWFSEGQMDKKRLFLKTNPYFLALPLLFLVYGLGLLYTENLTYGFQKIETRLSLFILPIVLPTLIHAHWQKNKEKYAMWFIGAATLGSLICIVRGLTFCFQEQSAWESGTLYAIPVGYNYVFSSHLTGFIMHPGYYAVFVLMAIFMLINLWLSNRKKFLNIWSVLVLLVLITLVFLSYAKAALLVLLVLCGILGVQVAVRFKKLIYLLYSGLLAIFVLIIFYFFVPNTQERIQAIIDVQNESTLDPTSTESTQARVHAWMAAKATMSKSPWIGFGTGDGNDQLFKTYADRGYTGALSVELNAHNEYFQTGLALGLMGILFLIAPMLWSVLRAVRTKNFMLGSWAIAAILVFLFESYLNTLAGALFFSLFFVIFALMNFSENEAHEASI
jgi:O-antigen ligase